MTAASTTRRYVVTGRVQGVGFRWFVEREARALGLGGWVRNRANGSVEVLASGTNQQLNALYDKLKQGPRAARVDNVDVEEAAPLKDAGTFRIEGAWGRMHQPKTSCDPLKALIREVPDFPKPGILFYDITTLLKDKLGFARLIDSLT